MRGPLAAAAAASGACGGAPHVRGGSSATHARSRLPRHQQPFPGLGGATLLLFWTHITRACSSLCRSACTRIRSSSSPCGRLRFGSVCDGNQIAGQEREGAKTDRSRSRQDDAAIKGKRGAAPHPSPSVLCVLHGIALAAAGAAAAAGRLLGRLGARELGRHLFASVWICDFRFEYRIFGLALVLFVACAATCCSTKACVSLSQKAPQTRGRATRAALSTPAGGCSAARGPFPLEELRGAAPHLPPPPRRARLSQPRRGPPTKGGGGF